MMAASEGEAVVERHVPCHRERPFMAEAVWKLDFLG
jgi:hypothetical protein